MAPILERPGATPPVDLAEHPLEAGLVRLAVQGAEGFELSFDDPGVTAALAACLASEGDEPFDPERLVVMGYSAGGHLALTTGLLTPAAGLDRIDECDPGLYTGELVVYHANGGNAIGGLSDGTTYYAIPLTTMTGTPTVTFAPPGSSSASAWRART